jgi:hypothetical protein
MFTQDEKNLHIARQAIFVALVRRMRSLYLSRKLPSSYYVGQEYVEDSTKLDCEILVGFNFPATIERAGFWFRKSRIIIEQQRSVLEIHIYRKISGRLWDDIKYLRRGDGFIVGYVNAIMPTINRLLLDNRYLSGQLLSRTFFLQEAIGIILIHGNQQIQIPWPVSIAPFPPAAKLASRMGETYLRDFIDAMHCYFKNDFDDCIRRIITSTENFFESLRWKAKTGPNSFRQILDDNIDSTIFDNQVIMENLKSIYGVRNKIVHQGFRMSASSALFCDKAVSTLKYLLHRHVKDAQISRYVHTLGLQFVGLQSMTGNMINLDQLEKANPSSHDHVMPIDNISDFNRWMFTTLRFTSQDKASIRR